MPLGTARGPRRGPRARARDLPGACRAAHGGTAAAFFARLTDLGFACLAFEPPRRRLRRAEVPCARGDGENWFGYAGGWSKGGGVFIVDRVRAGCKGSAELLGGAQVGGHLRAVLGGPEPEGGVTVQARAVP